MIVGMSLRMDKQYDADRSILEEDYLKYLQGLGFDVVLLPNTLNNVQKYLERRGVQGVILSGGNDVDPAEYGGSSEGLSLAPLRDKTEDEMLEYALEKKLPVLGICRGMQRLNVHFGGKLIDFKSVGIDHPVRVDHEVEVDGKQIMVNSYHRQGLRSSELSSELKMFAITADGIVEGIYHPSLPIAGIQWHPERKSPDEEYNLKVVEAFRDRELYWK
jgi:N5-(cytidine 5'-diphosphoramidyl)-L-glutamine hydrolase